MFFQSQLNIHSYPDNISTDCIQVLSHCIVTLKFNKTLKRISFVTPSFTKPQKGLRVFQAQHTCLFTFIYSFLYKKALQ